MIVFDCKSNESAAATAYCRLYLRCLPAALLAIAFRRDAAACGRVEPRLLPLTYPVCVCECVERGVSLHVGVSMSACVSEGVEWGEYEQHNTTMRDELMSWQ